MPKYKVGEEWRPIDGYEEFYQVSNLGRIKALPRKTGNRQGSYITPERILKPYVCKSGYCDVSLYSQGKPKKFRVHRLVALAFVPKEEMREYVNHKNSDRKDNVATNLEWCTPLENALHGKLYGNINKHTHCKGGHLMAETARVDIRGDRYCLVCRKSWERKYYRERVKKYNAEAVRERLSELEEVE
jgi:hypothetical protein